MVSMHMNVAVFRNQGPQTEDESYFYVKKNNTLNKVLINYILT